MGTFSVRLTQDEFENAFNRLYGDNFSVSGQYTGGKKYVEIKCKRCGTKFNRIANNLKRGTLSCPQCDKFRGGKVELIVGVNDMNTTNPYQSSFLRNYDDGYKYTYSTHKELEFVCPNCGAIHHKRPRDMFGKNGNFRCQLCSDGFPYTEKFIHSLLKQCGEDYIYQYSSKDALWCSKFRYDFYLPKYNCVIEANGIQHYYKNHAFFITLEEQKKIDEDKRVLAISNGVDYVSIDCSYSTVEYLKSNILKSRLSEILDLSAVDWKKCGEFASNSLMNKVCSEWDSNYEHVQKIAENNHICKETVIKYLNDGNSIGLCNFDLDDYRAYKKKIHYKNMALNRHRPIVCIETGKVYDSFAEIKRIENFYITKDAIGNPNKTSHGFHWDYIIQSGA